ncbi:MAG: response regulator [Desulfobacteraceae bacterium]|nr:response regulator [Desulfobacteraceae bacterium]
MALLSFATYKFNYDSVILSQSKFTESIASKISYDLIITDMTMPEMTGDRLIQAIRKVDTKLPIIICTGFSDKLTPKRGVDIGANGLLLKPVVKSEMTKMVENLLNEKCD